MKTLDLQGVIKRFNAASPRQRSKRTVQRWLENHQITGSGTSTHNWFYPEADVESALRKDFPFAFEAGKAGAR